MTYPLPTLDFMPALEKANVEIFDPPLCCPTGICGPTIDQTLVDMNDMLLTLQAEGVSVTRYQMASNPNAFLNNPEVMRHVREKQMAALPITVVLSKVIKVGSYPTLSEIKDSLNGHKA